MLKTRNMVDQSLDQILSGFGKSPLPTLPPRIRQRSWTALKAKCLSGQPGETLEKLREAYLGEKLGVDKTVLEASSFEAFLSFLEIYFCTLDAASAEDAMDGIGSELDAVVLRTQLSVEEHRGTVALPCDTDI
eukprot:PhF_6_TR34676/c1_g1_i5/m.50457